jgi:predicted DCC family thiol-disulfide oxidoreductase YuxK
MRPALTVWHNSKCPICEAGIRRERYKLRTLVADGKIAFRDINFDPDALKAFGVGVDDVRRRLHGVDRHGRLLVGADVAIALWRLTPGRGWLAALLAAPGVVNVARFGYDRFADLLFAWNKRVGRW